MEPNKFFSVFSFSLIQTFVISVLLILISCKDDPQKTGLELVPSDDKLSVYVDTIPVELYTISANSVYIKNIGLSPLGSYISPVCGQLKADFMTDIMWISEITWAGGIKKDSINIQEMELKLVFQQSYGDKNDIHFDVYELVKSLPSYYESDFNVTSDLYDPNPINIGEPQRISDTTNIYSVKLSQEYALKFFDDDLITDSVYYVKNFKKFRDHMKGLYIKTNYKTGTGGGIIIVDHLFSELLLRVIEWKNGNSDTNEYKFVLGDPGYYGRYINIYENINNLAVNAVLNDTVNLHSDAFLQALSGPKVLVRIPELANKREEWGENAVVNKAELILPINSELSESELFRIPPYLSVYDVATDTFVIDDAMFTGFIDGSFDTTQNEYRINIPNHIHYYVYGAPSGKTISNNLYLFIADFIYPTSSYTCPIAYYSIRTPGAVVLENAGSAHPPLLRVFYSKLPK